MQLCGRNKALAEALPIYDGDESDSDLSDTSYTELPHFDEHALTASQPSPQWDHRSTAISITEHSSADTADVSRKRKRFDESAGLDQDVQLPTTLLEHKHDIYPPFQPSAALNKPDEPAPDFAQYPTIGQRASLATAMDESLNGTITAEKISEVGEDTSGNMHIALRNHKSVASMRAASKKQVIMTREKWTDAETDQLLKGVAMFGVGKWKKILLHPDFKFTTRTPGDLKDR